MKVLVGTDDYCPVCKDWQQFDDNGKCKICGTLIKKDVRSDHTMVREFDLCDFDEDSGEE